MDIQPPIIEPTTPAPPAEPVPQPPQPAPPVTPAAPMPPQASPPKSPVTIIAIVLGILLVLSIIVGFSLYRQRASSMVSAPTPTHIPAIPTPTPALSALAGKPEFIQLEEATATLSAAIAAYNPQDETLTPPTLVLPLGFSTQ